jgi:hypothetical protein
MKVAPPNRNTSQDTINIYNSVYDQLRGEKEKRYNFSLHLINVLI